MQALGITRRLSAGHRFTSFALALLAATALTAAPARADGGNGGSSGNVGGTGATGFTGSAGGAGNPGGFGGGGGGAAGGGNGGNGAGPAGQAGGTGAAAAGGTGGNGGNNTIGIDGGGGGGGGGGNGNGTGAATVANTGALTGGLGGNGGSVVVGGGNGGGGGGGGGGYGAIVTGSGASSNSGTVTGGNGGSGGGGNGFGNGGNGGTGGVGLQFSGSGAIFTNTGTVIGGNGGGGGGGGIGGVGGAGIVGSGLTVINGGAGTISGGLSAGAVQANAITFTVGGGVNVLELQNDPVLNITGNVVAASAADTLRLGGSGNQSLDTSMIGAGQQFQNFGVFEKTGTGTWTLTGAPSQATSWTITQGALAVSNDTNLGTSGETLTFNGGTLQLLSSFGTSRPMTLNAVGGTIDTNGNNLVVSSAILGTGGLTKNGVGILNFQVAQTYTGGTTINAGTLFLDSVGGALAPTGALTVNGGTFDMSFAGGFPGSTVTVGTLSGAGGVIDLGPNILVTDSAGSGTLASVITGTGGLVKQGSGVLTLTGVNTFTGGTTVNAGGLVVNGSVASPVTVNGGTLGGSGTIAGLVANGGALAPGNSIGTLSVTGSFVQNAGSTYQVEVNAAGQADRINVTGAPGTATINGGTVAVLAEPGIYAARTTYTILNATGGVSGAYTSVTSNFAFLTPSLAYDANNVFLTLALNSFAIAGLTPNQTAVAVSLDQSLSNATGDFATVLGTIAGLSTIQGPAALNAISGEPWADFATMNVNNSAMFMNALGQQMANARNSSESGQRVALAQACDIAACDGASPFSVWASALGGLGSVQGDTNASTLTYNFGGAAAGIDYRLDPRFLVGIGVGYTHGTQWVNSFMGQGWSDSVSVAAYGSFTQSGFYVDALAGYAYFNNQLQRQIQIPGLQPRTANGSTGANQFLGQVETGYRLGVYAPALATVTPFGRLQMSSTTQNAFSEWGADSLSLNVAQQGTNSLRSTLGADLGGRIGLGDTRTLDLALRLGWLHEFANVARPITAAFAGAPGNSFTVFGATPLRNAAVIGFQASATVADSTQLYLRYDGELANGTDNHALNVGLRMSW